MKTRKALSLLLVFTMLLSLFSGLKKEASADDSLAPTIPKYGDGTKIEDYDPEEDGYYGYLPVRYYPSGQGNEGTIAYLPVLVWNNTVFARAGQLAEVSGLSLTSDTVRDAYAAHFSVYERHLLIRPQQTSADFFLGETPRECLYSAKVTMEPAAFYTLEQEPVLWVPFSRVLTLMGVTAVCEEDDKGEFLCTILPPQKDSWDVLSELRSSKVRQDYAFSYEELTGYAEASGTMNITGRTYTTLDQILHAKGEYIWYLTLSSFSGWTDLWGYITDQDINLAEDQWNRIVGKKMLEELWFCSESEAEAMGEVNAAKGDLITRFLTAVFRKSPEILTDAGNLETSFVYRQLENASQMATGHWAVCVDGMRNSAKQMLESQARMLKVVNKISDLAPVGVTLCFTGVNAYISYNSYIDAYDSRDVFLENCLKDFLSDTGNHRSIGTAASEAMKKEYDSILEDYKGYGTGQAAADALVSLVVDGATDALSSPIAVAVAVYRIAAGTIPYFKKTLASMDSYMTSLFGLSLEKDTEKALLNKLAGAGTWTEAERLDVIEAAYLYLKTCCCTAQLAKEVLTDESVQEELTAERKSILTDLGILTAEYTSEDGGRMVSASIREQMDAYYALDDSGLIDSVIKLYVTVTGDVKNMEDDSPVPDAKCEIYGRDNELINVFYPDGEGKYGKISVPALEPTEIEEEPDLDFVLSFDFTSPTVEGQDELTLKYESALEKEMQTAYLGGSGQYGVAVEAGGAVYYIKYTMDSHMTNGLTGYFTLLPNQPNQLIRLKDGEETVLAETPASGKIAAARGQIFFTGEYREDGRTIKAVDMDGGTVKTLCTGELLGALESGSHIVLTNYTGLYTMDTTPSDTQETYVMNKISNDGYYITTYRERVIYYEISGNTIYVYSIAADNDDDRMLLGRLDAGFRDSLGGITIGEVRMPEIDGEDYLYMSYGSIAGSYIMYQGGRIARFNLNQEESAEIVAGTGELVDADFTVNADGSVNPFPYQEGRLSAGLYTANAWYYFSRDGILYDIDVADGHEEPVLYPEEYAAISGSRIDYNDDGTYLKVYYYTKQEDRVYIYCTLGIADGGGLGWRPSFNLAGGALIQKDLKTGEVNFLFRY